MVKLLLVQCVRTTATTATTKVNALLAMQQTLEFLTIKLFDACLCLAITKISLKFASSVPLAAIIANQLRSVTIVLVDIF